MDAVITFTKNMCFAAIGSSVLCFLLPKGNVSKTAKTVISFFLIWVSFFPIAEIFKKDFSKDLEFDYNIESDTSLSDTALKYVCAQTEASIGNILKENDLDYKEIIAECNIQKDGIININRIEIISGGNTEEIKKAVYKETGLIPEITPIKDDENSG